MPPVHDERAEQKKRSTQWFQDAPRRIRGRPGHAFSLEPRGRPIRYKAGANPVHGVRAEAEQAIRVKVSKGSDNVAGEGSTRSGNACVRTSIMSGDRPIKADDEKLNLERPIKGLPVSSVEGGAEPRTDRTEW